MYEHRLVVCIHKPGRVRVHARLSACVRVATCRCCADKDIHMSTYLYIYQSINLSIYVSIYPSIYIRIYLDTYRSGADEDIHSNLHMDINLSIYVSIHPAGNSSGRSYVGDRINSSLRLSGSGEVDMITIWAPASVI